MVRFWNSLLPRVLAACVGSQTVSLVASTGVEGITLSDDRLKVELIDTHPDDFFLSHDMDLRGRLFVGCREAVYRYDRNADGSFTTREEIFRFPKDTWVYDLEVFGEDVLALTNTALYRMPGATGGGKMAKPQKILWGNPLGHHHQGLHGMEFAPDGALLIALGDPHPGLNLDKSRPDHFWHWTWFVGPENKKVPYSGVGGVIRFDLENHELSVFASGLRNPCGISFDRDWNLFGNDNDQEGSTATPCRLVQVPANSWGGWARGWDLSQNPERLDMLPTVNWELDVPVGQGYYDHDAFGADYKGSLFVSNWGNRTVSRHPLQAKGAGFEAKSKPFFRADGLRRPVSAMPTNDGSMVIAVCYMNGNEGSPVRQTDLLLVSPREPSASAGFDVSEKTLLELLSGPLQLRAKAHRQILSLGGSELAAAASAFQTAAPEDPAFSSLIFLAAAQADASSIERVVSLASGEDRAAALAWRAAATQPDKFHSLSDEAIKVTASSADPVVLAGMLEFLHAAERPLTNAVAGLAAHSDPYVRQSAALLLARQAPKGFLDRLAKSPDHDARVASALATSFRIWEAAEKVTSLPEGSQPALEKHMLLSHTDGRIDLRELNSEVGIFTLSDWWRDAGVREVHAVNIARLIGALEDTDQRVAHAAAVGLFFLGEPLHEKAITKILDQSGTVLSLEVGKASKADLTKALSALKDAKLSNDTEIPEAFRGIDWDKEEKGNVEAGKLLFTQRGCIACHLAPHDGAGGAIGPSLVGAGERFPPNYLAASLLVPNLTVSPNFHPNTITMKDGTVHTGYVEKGSAAGMVKLRVVTGQLVELDKKEISKQEASEQSMMPAGLIQNPAEMRDIIAYMQVAKEKKKRPAKPKAKKNPKTNAKAKGKSVAPLAYAHPNIVLILADDFGWGDASCNHPDSPLQTPAIDRIAKEGIRLTNAHTPSSVCTPTRYGVLTGRYPWRSYLKNKVLPYYAPALITSDMTTLPSYLGKQGYRSGGFGKWHLGLDWTPVEGDPANWREHWENRDPEVGARVAQGIDHTKPFGNGPTAIGFNTFFGTPSNCGRLPFFIQGNRVHGEPQFDKKGVMRDPACAKDKVDDLYVARAIRFMETHQKDFSERPFFVYLPLNAIHGTTAVPERFQGKSGISKREDRIPWADQSVRRILAALDEMKVTDNTLVIFTSDNGPTASPTAAAKGHHSTGSYRGLKTNVYDGGTRVPFLARWPGKIPAGSTSGQLFGLTDLLATVAAVCGQPLPESAGPDSRNQLPVLLQQEDAIEDRSPLVTASYEGFLTIRDQRWKAVFGTKWTGGHPGEPYGGEAPEGTPVDNPAIGQLFDLQADPEEQNDLWEAHPEVVAEFREQLAEIKASAPIDPEGPPAITPANEEEGFVPIFDGQDLTDWDYRDGAWKVEDGAIVCTGVEEERNWIIWRKEQPANFVLRLDFKWNAGNSGVQVRSDDLGDHQVFGYQVEIATQKKMGLWHHSLLGKEDPSHEARFFMARAGEEVTIAADGTKTTTRVTPAARVIANCKDKKWNTLEIVADGSTLTQFINGALYSTVTDHDTRMSRPKGFIALQDHGKGCQVSFRNIRIKILP